MENQKEVLAALEASPALPNASNTATKPPESYPQRIGKMSDKHLRAETRRQGRKETQASNGMGIALATVLLVFLDSHAAKRPPYLR
jgi:hypothetical protein